MKETYRELRERQQKEFNTLPLKFYYSNEQFEKGMYELGLKPKEYDKIYIVNENTFCKKEDVDKVVEFINRSTEELIEAFQDYDFVVDAFEYEFDDHSCYYTGKWTHGVNAIAEALGVEPKDVYKNDVYLSALGDAVASIVEREEQKESMMEREA